MARGCPPHCHLFLFNNMTARGRALAVVFFPFINTTMRGCPPHRHLFLFTNKTTRGGPPRCCLFLFNNMMARTLPLPSHIVVSMYLKYCIPRKEEIPSMMEPAEAADFKTQSHQLSQSAFEWVAGGSEAESSGPKAEGGWEGRGFNNRSVVPSTCAVSLFRMQCDARAKADEF
jgi:hypothetical protein